MSKVTIEDLVIGHKYWVLCFKNRNKDHHHYCALDVNIKSLNESFKLCTYINEFKKNNISYTYCFEPVDEKDNWIEIDSYMVSVFVFKEIDDCLVALYKLGLSFSDDEEIKFNDYISSKMKESQNINPHKWIF